MKKSVQYIVLYLVIAAVGFAFQNCSGFQSIDFPGSGDLPSSLGDIYCVNNKATINETVNGQKQSYEFSVHCPDFENLLSYFESINQSISASFMQYKTVRESRSGKAHRIVALDFANKNILFQGDLSKLPTALEELNLANNNMNSFNPSLLPNSLMHLDLSANSISEITNISALNGMGLNTLYINNNVICDGSVSTINATKSAQLCVDFNMNPTCTITTGSSCGPQTINYTYMARGEDPSYAVALVDNTTLLGCGNSFPNFAANLSEGTHTITVKVVKNCNTGINEVAASHSVTVTAIVETAPDPVNLTVEGKSTHIATSGDLLKFVGTGLGSNPKGWASGSESSMPSCPSTSQYVNLPQGSGLDQWQNKGGGRWESESSHQTWGATKYIRVCVYNPNTGEKDSVTITLNEPPSLTINGDLDEITVDSMADLNFVAKGMGANAKGWANASYDNYPTCPNNSSYVDLGWNYDGGGVWSTTEAYPTISQDRYLRFCLLNPDTGKKADIIVTLKPVVIVKANGVRGELEVSSGTEVTFRGTGLGDNPKGWAAGDANSYPSCPNKTDYVPISWTPEGNGTYSETNSFSANSTTGVTYVTVCLYNPDSRRHDSVKVKVTD